MPFIKKLTSRKLLLALAGALVVYLNPSVDIKTLLTMLGLPGLYIIMEGLKDTFKKQV